MAASLPQCAAAARLALPATRAELAELRRGLQDGARVASGIPADDSQNASFREVCADLSFVKTGRPDANALLLRMASVTSALLDYARC